MKHWIEFGGLIFPQIETESINKYTLLGGKLSHWFDVLLHANGL